MKKLKLQVFLPPFILLVAAVTYSILDFDGFKMATTSLNDFLLDRFGWLYSLAAFSFLIICIWVYFSPIAKTKIGGEQAKPILTKWRWFAITLCTTIAVGILFWGAAEPIYHLHQPPKGLNIEPNSIASLRFSMSTMFMHWTIVPYAIYTLAGLVFAIVYYNYKRPFSLGALLYPVLGDHSKGWLSEVIDAICLFSLVAGMAASLGAGILTISGGLENIFNLSTTQLTIGIIACAIVGTFILSAISGLMKGIRILSVWNIRIFIGIAVFVLVTGPTLFLMKIGVEGLGEFFQTFFQRSLYVGLEEEDKWAQSWTIFYWANWLAWTPVTALFLGRLAVGYTVRDYIKFNLIYPSIFGGVWMVIFSGTALQFDFFSEGSPMFTVLNEQGTENVIYAIFNQLPLPKLLSMIFLIATFLSFVTASDSNTSAMSGISTTGISPENPEANVWIKILWGIIIGAVAVVMITTSGIDGIKMASNLGGFPALILMIFVAVGLVKLVAKANK